MLHLHLKSAQRGRNEIHLQADLHPVQLRLLEELDALQLLEQAAPLLVFRRPVVQLVQHERLEQLLVAHPHLDWVALQAVNGRSSGMIHNRWAQEENVHDLHKQITVKEILHI